LGILNFEYELISPGKGRVEKISSEAITCEFIGEEISALESFGTLSFGEVNIIREKEEELDFGQINHTLKDKVLVGDKWSKIAVIKANAVGASAVIGNQFYLIWPVRTNSC